MSDLTTQVRRRYLTRLRILDRRGRIWHGMYFKIRSFGTASLHPSGSQM